MIFLSKQNNTSPGQSSNTEACVSILGLCLAIGLIGGAAALIYGIFIVLLLNYITYSYFFAGLVKGNLTATIGGAAVFGISALFSIILVLVFIYCLKNNNVNSNINQHQHQHQHNHHVQHGQTSSHELAVISGIHKYDNHSQQQQPSKTSSFVLSNQNNGLINNQNYRSVVNTNTKRNNYNRY
jgi:hypothetical protein